MSLSTDLDEKELLLRMQNGDTLAFDAIYRAYGEMIALRLQRLIKLPEHVEELHQDVFVRLWNHRLQLNPSTSIKAYLFTIARNLAIDFYRKTAKSKELEGQLLRHISLSYHHIDMLLNYKETQQIIEDVISKLPERRQEVFRMIKLEGRSYKEASHYFGVSMSTIKDHMEKSSAFLKTQLRVKYPDIIFGIIAQFLFI